MAWTWEFTKKSESQFKKLDNELKKRIVAKLDFWVNSGAPLKFADTLTNYELGSYRFRVGNYRISFDVDDETILVISVGHRRDIYK